MNRQFDETASAQSISQIMNSKSSSLEGLNTEILQATVDIMSAYVSYNTIASDDIPALIKTVFATLSGIANDAIEDDQENVPAVPVRKSIAPDYIICLEDGKKLKMLKRYLRSQYDMTPEDYRAKWRLPPDYPMVAPNYAAERSKLAKKIGLGRRRGARKKS